MMMVKKVKPFMAPISPVTVQSELGDSTEELHKVLVNYLLGQMRPLETGKVFALVPLDYDEMDLTKRYPKFDSHFDLISGRDLLFVPRQRLVKVTLVKSVTMDDGKTYYLVARKGSYLIVNKLYTKEVDQKFLGFFVKNK